MSNFILSTIPLVSHHTMTEPQHNLSNTVSLNNKDFIKDQISKKKLQTPYYSTEGTVSNVITDMDSFPYRRYFRGEYKNPRPVIMEREAGYRKRIDGCYTQDCGSERNVYPNHCFETACSTVYPCYPDTLRKYADKAEMEVMLNNSCIPLYR